MKDPFGMIFVITPPTVSIPNDKGVASITIKPWVSSLSSPQIIPPWMAAPVQMASSGLIPVFGSFPLKNSLTNCLTLGILLDPPTNTISSILFFFKPESSKAVYIGPKVFLNRSELSSSNLALVRTSDKSRPSARSSISIVVSWVADKALLAFSTSLFSFWIALLSLERSLLCFFLINLMKWSMTL